MSMACPIIVSNAGGNPELATSKYIFRRGDRKQLRKILKEISYEDLEKEAERSFKDAKKYNKEILNEKRKEFYDFFINS